MPSCFSDHSSYHIEIGSSFFVSAQEKDIQTARKNARAKVCDRMRMFDLLLSLKPNNYMSFIGCTDLSNIENVHLVQKRIQETLDIVRIYRLRGLWPRPHHFRTGGYISFMDMSITIYKNLLHSGIYIPNSSIISLEILNEE